MRRKTVLVGTSNRCPLCEVTHKSLNLLYLETEQKKPSETQNTELKETDKNSFLREMASKYKRYCTEERSVRISPKICQGVM
jgi:hypothetical protein